MTSIPACDGNDRTRSISDEYQHFIEVLASKDPLFQPLNAFLMSSWAKEARVRVVTFPHNAPPQPEPVIEVDLEQRLAKQADPELYVVEDLSPTALRVLGGHCGIDAQFFLDYLDTVLRTSATPRESRETRYGTVTRPWYRLSDIENHIPALRSVQKVSNYVHLRFIGPREYHANQPGRQAFKVSERLDLAEKQHNVERLAGGHNPIPLKDQSLWPVAMTRHSAAVWFDAGPQWQKAIVLLDPPLVFTQDSLQRQSSKYRTFLVHTSPNHPSSLKIDRRDTYMESFIHCLEQNPDLRTERPAPVTIIQDLYRIVASEWIAFNAYLERDLNVIEWRLERDGAKISNLDVVLEQLFVRRRRTRKYEALVEDQLHLNIPAHWLDARPQAIASAEAIRSDFQQVKDLICRNNERIAQTVSLITSLMSVMEGKRATSLNQRLTFLAVLATVALPFNVFAAVFGMQTMYAPGQQKFDVFLWISLVTVGLVLLCYLGFLVAPRIERRIRVRMGT